MTVMILDGSMGFLVFLLWRSHWLVSTESRLYCELNFSLYDMDPYSTISCHYQYLFNKAQLLILHFYWDILHSLNGAVITNDQQILYNK